MAFVQDQVGGDDSATTFTVFTVNFSANVTVHNTVGTFLAHNNTQGTFTSISDTKADTVSAQVDSVTDANGNIGRSHYIKDAIGGATDLSANFGGGGSNFIHLCAQEFSGRDNTAPLDGHNMAHQATPGTGTDGASSGNLSTTATDDIAGFFNDGTSAQASITAGTSYTGKKQLTTSIGLVGMNEVREAAASGNNPVTFTVGSNLDSITAGMAFKAASAGGDAIGPANIAQSAGRYIGWIV